MRALMPFYTVDVCWRCRDRMTLWLLKTGQTGKRNKRRNPEITMPSAVIINIIRTIAVGILMMLTIGLIEAGVGDWMSTMIDIDRDPRLPDGAEVVMMTTTATIIITMTAMVIVTTAMDTGTAEEVVVVAEVEVEGDDRVVGQGNGGEDTAMRTVNTRVARTRSQNRPSLPSHGQGRNTMLMHSNIVRDLKSECIIRMRITGGEMEKQKIPKPLLVKWTMQWIPSRERAEGSARTKSGAEVIRIVIVIETKRIVQSIVNGNAAIAQEVEAGVVIVSLLVVKSVVKAIDLLAVSMIGEGKKPMRMIITGHEEAKMKIVRREGMALVIADIGVPAEVLVVRKLDRSRSRTRSQVLRATRKVEDIATDLAPGKVTNDGVILVRVVPSVLTVIICLQKKEDEVGSRLEKGVAVGTAMLIRKPVKSRMTGADQNTTLTRTMGGSEIERNVMKIRARKSSEVVQEL